MTTPLTLISAALKDSGVLGVGQSASAEDTNDAFDKVNRMLSQWSLRRWLVYHLLDLPLTSTGATSYTIGVGGSFSTPRVDRLEDAFIRQPVTGGQPVDYPLTIIESRETYDQIALKSMVTLPQYVFMDTGYPLGTLYFYPCPTASIYEIHVVVKATLPRFTTLVQDIALPAEYEEAIVYNLAMRLRPAYQMPPDPTVTALARASLNTIKSANAQIPLLKMPSSVMNRSGSEWNIYSGGYG